MFCVSLTLTLENAWANSTAINVLFSCMANLKSGRHLSFFSSSLFSAPLDPDINLPIVDSTNEYSTFTYSTWEKKWEKKLNPPIFFCGESGAVTKVVIYPPSPPFVHTSGGENIWQKKAQKEEKEKIKNFFWRRSGSFRSTRKNPRNQRWTFFPLLYPKNNIPSIHFPCCYFRQLEFYHLTHARKRGKGNSIISLFVVILPVATKDSRK